MLIIGERINSSRKPIQEALKARDAAFLQEEARKQVEAGAAYVDVNAATMMQAEPEYIEWLVRLVQETVDAPLCIDTPNPVAMEVALKAHRGRAMINSISGEKERYEAVLPLAVKYKAAVVALCMDDRGMPETASDRLRVVEYMLKNLTDAGIAKEDIYFDPLVKPVSAGSHYGVEFLESIRLMKEKYGVKTVAGLSNVSYGLPLRRLLNQAFLVMSMNMGLDAVIVDPLDATLMSFLRASRVLLGKDEYAMEYLGAFREGKLVKT